MSRNEGRRRSPRGWGGGDRRGGTAGVETCFGPKGVSVEPVEENDRERSVFMPVREETGAQSEADLWNSSAAPARRTVPSHPRSRVLGRAATAEGPRGTGATKSQRVTAAVIGA